MCVGEGGPLFVGSAAAVAVAPKAPKAPKAAANAARLRLAVDAAATSWPRELCLSDGLLAIVFVVSLFRFYCYCFRLSYFCVALLHDMT